MVQALLLQSVLRVGTLNIYIRPRGYGKTGTCILGSLVRVATSVVLYRAGYTISYISHN